MGKTFNIYCDESCHLENDHQTAMVFDLYGLNEEERKIVLERSEK